MMMNLHWNAKRNILLHAPTQDKRRRRQGIQDSHQPGAAAPQNM